MNFRAVIFDLFGTLVDGFVAVSGSYQEDFAAALGVEHDAFMQRWRQISNNRTLGDFQTVEASIEHVCDQMGAPVKTEQLAKAVDIRLELTRRALAPKADALSTVAQLKTAGFKVGLLSNCSIEIPLVWPETDLAEWFDAAIFSSRERLKKPDPRIYNLACARLGVPPEDCLYIADGENHELAAAAGVGMHPVLVRNSTQGQGSEVLREAREWRGTAISALPEALPLLGLPR
jgi:putative hydrolase of the HAD superfamily